MEYFTKGYGIDLYGFKTTMKSSFAFVAGSHELSRYLSCDLNNSDFRPTNMSIFIPNGVCGDANAHRENLVDIFIKANFDVNDGYDVTNESFQSIDTIDSLINGNKRIQIIVINCTDVLEYISYNFDIRVKIGWTDHDSSHYYCCSNSN